MNITVIQNKSQREILGSGGANIIEKLYELAIDSNNSLTLEGWIKSPSAYGYQVDYLNTHFNDLEVETDNRYVNFVDPEFKRIVIEKYSTDGVGVTQAQLNAITSIGDPGTSGTFANAITNNTTLTSLSDLLKFKGLTSFPEGLGYGDTNVTEVGIPSSLTEIGNENFFKDSPLQKIIIEDLNSFLSVLHSSYWGAGIFEPHRNNEPFDTYTLDSQGNYVKITTVNINISGKNITRMSFAHCNTITTLNITGDFNNNCGGSIFGNCDNLQTVNFLSNITHLPSNCFENCTSLTQINTIDLNTIQLDNFIFYNCTSLNFGVQYLPQWTIRYGSDTRTFTTDEGLQYTSEPQLMFAGCTFEQLYVPNLIRTAIDTRYRDWYTCGSMFGSCNVAPDTQYQVLYFKNIQNFYPGEFNRIKASAIVINNTTVPVFKNTLNYSDSYSDTRDELKKEQSFQRWDTTNKIYVPDSAVNDYKIAPIWSKVASYIYPMSDLQQYATQADWEAAGKPVGLIQAYMS